MKDKLLGFDIFTQGVTLRTSKKSQQLPSWMGLFWTLLVVALTLVYFTLRLEVLWLKKESQIATLETKNGFEVDTVFNITVGADDFDFRFTVLLWDLDLNQAPDLDRMGTLGFFEVKDYWDYELNK